MDVSHIDQQQGEPETAALGTAFRDLSAAGGEAGGKRVSRWFWPILLGLCLVGLAQGGLILGEYLDENPLAQTPISDAKVYWRWAEAIARGAILGDTPFLSAPLYPYLLGLVRAAGGGLKAVYYLQLVAHVATAACVALIGRSRFGPTVGLLSAGLFLLLDEPVFASTRLLATSIQLLLLALLWMQLLHIERSRSPGAFGLGGLLLGLNCLANPPMMLLVALLGGWALFRSARWPRRMQGAALFVVPAVLIISVATVHNWLASREIIAITAHAGITFRQGNAPGSEGTYTVIPGISGGREEMFRDAAHVYQRETGQPPNWRKIDAFFFRQGLNEWKFKPLWAVKLAARKLYYFLSSRNISDIYLLRAERHEGLADRLWLAPIPVAWLMGPAVVAVFLMLRHPGCWWPELVLVFTPLLVTVTFWYSPRYRIPAVPVLAVLAAWMLVRAEHVRLHQRFSIVVAGALALAIGFGPVNRAVGFDPLQVCRELLGLQLGQAYFEQGRLEEAVHAYRDVLEDDPHDPKAHHDLAYTLAMQGELHEAVSHYRQAIRLRPDYAIAHSNLGLALDSLGQRDEAMNHYRQALQINPHLGTAHNNLGIALRLQGRLGEAIHHYERALEADPSLSEAHNNWGAALLALGKPDEAIGHFAEALRIGPDDPKAHNILARALVMAHRFGEALEHFERATLLQPEWPVPCNEAAWILATHPDPNLRDGSRAVELAERACTLTGHQNAEILDTLAAAYAEAGHFDKARATAKAAVKVASQAQARELAETIGKRLELYEQGERYRQPAGSPAGVWHDASR